ncbi:MAG: hypothetical protein EOO37_01095 [Cytophagaceae bacterium]|nr:MAG: hypothetical protein EOO37_01095 [Cytophagaceae bacterium]
MEPITQNPSQLPGWNIDNDPDNDPTYPMRTRTPDDHKGYSWERPTQQPINIEVLHSIERPNVTAVFGTSVPPSGLSGVIRRFAFKYSENSYLHWLPLLLADRVNVVEGVLDDLAHGQVPNIFAEKGYKVEWKYDRTGLIIKLATAAAIVGGAVVLLSGKGKKGKVRSAS